MVVITMMVSGLALVQKVVNMDKQEASKRIAELMEVALEALNAAVKIADEAQVSFETPWGGEGTSERGMGATYVPEGATNAKWFHYKSWNSSAGIC